MIIVAFFLLAMCIPCGHAIYKATAGPKKERIALGVAVALGNAILIISAFFLK